MSAVGVIPARYGSSRLPGKPLADLQGKPLLYYVFQRASQAQTLEKVLIATDDERIFAASKTFGAPVVMTSPDHRSGTDRIAEAVKDLEAEIIVNIQGDEPLIDSLAIDRVVEMLKEDPGAEMATLKAPIRNIDELENPNVVKVITDERGYALYFTRAVAPYIRDREFADQDIREMVRRRPELLQKFFKHIGLYAYRSQFLQRFTQWSPSPLELLEDLEQLRALEHGAKIKVDFFPGSIMGIDTPEDLERIRKLVEKNPKLLEV